METKLADIMLDEGVLKLEGEEVVVKARDLKMIDCSMRYLKTRELSFKSRTYPFGSQQPGTLRFGDINGNPYFKGGLITDDINIIIFGNQHYFENLQQIGAPIGVISKGTNLPNPAPNANPVPNMVQVVSVAKLFETLNKRIINLENKLKELSNSEI